jgi:hypothetical protein
VQPRPSSPSVRSFNANTLSNRHLRFARCVGQYTQSWLGALRPVASQAPGAAPGIQPSATPLKRIAVSSLVRLALSRSTESGPGQASADRAGDPRSSPETPMVGVLPLNHAQGDLALHTPIDRRAFRRPSTPTNRAWNLPAPPAPNRG